MKSSGLSIGADGGIGVAVGVEGLTADTDVGVGNASGGAVGAGALTVDAGVDVGVNDPEATVGAAPLTVDSASGVGNGCVLEGVSPSGAITVDSVDSEVVEERPSGVASVELDVNGLVRSD